MVRPSYFAKIQHRWRVEAIGVGPDFLHKHTSKARELFGLRSDGPESVRGLKVIPLIGRSEGCALSVNGYRNGLRKVADREIKNAPCAFDSSAVREDSRC